MRIPFPQQSLNTVRYFTAFFLLISLALMISCKTSSKSATENGGEKNKKKLSQTEQIELTGLFIDAIREKELGNTDKALGLFAQCVKRNGQYAPAMYEMAQLLNIQKQYDQALVMANGAVHIDPANEWYQQLLAEIYISQHNYSAAAKVLKPLSEKKSDQPDFAYDLANVYMLDNKYLDAIKVYDGIEKTFGISEELSMQKEKLYLSLQKPNKALEEIEKLVKQFPGETKYLGLLAELYMAAGDNFKALETYQRILDIDPNDPYAHLSLADYYRTQNNDAKSFDELKLAFGNPDLEIDAKIRILLQYYSRSETKPELKTQAYELTDIMVKTHPDDAKAWSMYGDYLYRDKRNEEARNAFRHVNAIDSSKFVVWDQLLLIESEMGDYKALLNESRRTMDIFPEQPEPYLYNGYANILLKQYDEAVKSLKAGLGFAVDNSLIVKLQTNLGEAFFQKNNYDDSFEAFEKVLKLDPQNTYVLNNYSYYLALQSRNLSRAEELARKLNDLVKNNAAYEDTYGWVLFKLQKYADAKTWIEKALSHGGDTNASILEHYGDVLYKLNDNVKSLEYWNKAKEAGGKSELLLKKINDKTWYE